MYYTPVRVSSVDEFGDPGIIHHRVFSKVLGRVRRHRENQCYDNYIGHSLQKDSSHQLQGHAH